MSYEFQQRKVPVPASCLLHLDFIYFLVAFQTWCIYITPQKSCSKDIKINVFFTILKKKPKQKKEKKKKKPLTLKNQKWPI